MLACFSVSSYVEELRQSANKHYVNSIAKTQVSPLTILPTEGNPSHPMSVNLEERVFTIP